ncbi:hypothetical protein ACFVFS_26070 [Kitasatospora sp. NPDC057692]|uniref:hypothetical protein n=1 Tax=Kitasatospora sp. NPDC057692 TaxID=3346215 RepID=UPI00367DDF5F
MTAEERGAGSGGDGADAFERELVVRLGARAEAVGGSPPLALLREAGRRRTRQRFAAQSVAGVAVLALGLAVVTQLGGGGGAGAVGPAGLNPTGVRSSDLGGVPVPSAGTGRPFPGLPELSPSSSGPDYLGPLASCAEGPASLRLLRWDEMHSATPSNWTPPPPRSPAMSPEPSSSTSGGQVNRHVGEVQFDVRRFVAMQYPEQYLGTCIDLLTAELWVLRVPGGDLDQKVLDTVRHFGVTIHFTDVPSSRRHFVELAARIKDTDRDYWAARGVTVQEVRISEDGTGVSVSTDQADAARADIVARYGAEVIEVRPVR